MGGGGAGSSGGGVVQPRSSGGGEGQQGWRESGVRYTGERGETESHTPITKETSGPILMLTVHINPFPHC